MKNYDLRTYKVITVHISDLSEGFANALDALEIGEHLPTSYVMPKYAERMTDAERHLIETINPDSIHILD